jgi:putative thiamine transport system permease protein
MSIPVLRQLRVDESYKAASSLGYSPAAFWWKCVLPQWLPRMRFPLIAVIAYSASVVDVSLIIGPTNPPTFAVLVWQWFSEADLNLYPRASAGALLLFILCSTIILLARAIEWFLLTHLRSWQTSGRRSPALPGKPLFALLAILFSATFVVTIIWSVAQRWRFPDLVPSAVTLRFWRNEWTSILTVINDSVTLALIAATIALFFALIAHEYRLHYRLTLPRYLIAIPMLVPQLSLLFGMQVGTLYLAADNYYLWVVWSHIFFAFPYVYLALDGPWSSFNQSYYLTALSLGKKPLRAWMAVKLPMLANAILFAWAIGASVSLAQYLPTLMLGGGRISTLTTEAVALASGFDRRVTAIYALWQTLLPLILFALTMATNRYINYALRTGGNKKKQGNTITHEPLSKKPRHP